MSKPTVLIDGKPVAAGTAAAFDKLAAAFKNATGESLHVRSGVRDTAEQRRIFLARYRVQATGSGPFGDVRWYQGKRYVRHSAAGTVAVPGTSRHEIGRAVDIYDSGKDFGVTRANTTRSKWIKANASKHGFTANGFSFGEPWHIEYTAGDQWKATSAAKPQPAPKPKPATAPRVRVGTLNIPLDAAKLPDGRARVIVAARQVHEANLAILACQELDRGYPGDTWYYARLMLSALRQHDKAWKIIKPTHGLNENVMYYRPSRASLKRRLDDVILTSSAGGRHATRATFTVGGKTVAVRNTHLVSGAKNAAARDEQAKQLAAVSGASTIILGDLNTPDLPAPLAKTHKSAKDAAKASTNAAAGTYAKWRECDVTGQVLDHIVVPKAWTVNGYTIVGATGSTLDQPRASDHLLAIASITIGA